jgi:iron complex outermembrane recepter protein
MGSTKAKLLATSAPILLAQMLALTPGVVYAQSENAAGDEIIVTGQRRQETFIEAPVAVSVFNEAAILQAKVDRPGDFLKLTSNVTFVQSNIPGEAYITIRGNTQIRVGDASVAYVIDGVQQLEQNNINQELLGLESIEVLKGPQGALYGRNAIGGAVVIRTRKPNFESFEGDLMAGIGNGESAQARGVISGPIVEG